MTRSSQSFPAHVGWLFCCAALLPIACADVSSDATVSGSASGQLTVLSERPTAGSVVGASYELEASFNGAPSRCATTTVGACTVNPCFRAAAPVTSSTPLPTVGAVSLVAHGITTRTLTPQSDGIYADQPVLGELPWTRGGQSITLDWAHFPGVVAGTGGAITMSSPPYVALSTGSAFAAVTTTLSRGQDLTVAWTCDSPPSSTDEVVVDVDGTITQVYCEFAAGAGTGAIPATALGSLEVGAGSYNVHSKQFASEDVSAAGGATWSLSFNVDATARTTYGLASGSVTIQ